MTTAQYLAETPPEFQKLFAEVGKIVTKRFPKAKATYGWGIPGWKIKRVSKLELPNYKGTADPDYIYIGLANRKAGISFYIWNPADYLGLDKHRAALTAAGFNVMRGCLQFNKKQPYPLAALEKFIKQIKT